MTNIKNAPAEKPLSISCSRGFLGWLYDSEISLAATTYQTNRLFMLGIKPDGSLSVFERLLDGAMGLTATDNRLYLATRYQIWQFDNALFGKDRYNCYDRLYVPRIAHTTGDLITHDVAIGREEKIFFINALYSCVATTNDRYSFSVVWKPSFISDLKPEDRCHLNGLAMLDGVPRYVTTVSDSDTAGGWREHRSNGGCVVDLQSNDIISNGLSMPHSPRIYQGKLWLLNSGSGAIGYINRDTGKFEPVVFCPGYLRGLSFHENFAIVGVSKPRHNDVFAGLELDKRLRGNAVDPRCGLLVIDLETGKIAHWLKFEGIVKELYDVQVLSGTRRPMALGFRSDEINRVIGFEEEGSKVLHFVATKTDPTVDSPVTTAQPDSDTRISAYRYQVSLYMTIPALLKQFPSLIFPSLEKLASVRKIREPLFAVAALRQDTPVGLAVAEPSADGTSAMVLSLFVDPAHRRKGIGGRLVSHMGKVACRVGCGELKISYRSDWPNATAMKHLLSRNNWSTPITEIILFKGAIEKVASADWLHGHRLPESYEIFPWSELTADERSFILQQQADDPWFPEVLTPFQEEKRIEYVNSVGLRYKGKVVGWVITHRLAPDTVQYTSLFVHRSLQRLGRAIPLLAEAVKRQIAADISYGVCQVQLDSARMMDFMMKHCTAYGVSVAELLCSRKELGPVATQGSERLIA